MSVFLSNFPCVMASPPSWAESKILSAPPLRTSSGTSLYVTVYGSLFFPRAAWATCISMSPLDVFTLVVETSGLPGNDTVYLPSLEGNGLKSELSAAQLWHANPANRKLIVAKKERIICPLG